MILKEAGFECPVTDITYCWGMSKMTIAREDKNYHKYDNMILVEFIEFLARLADRKFPAELDLHEKVEMMLDKILPLVNYERNTVAVVLEEESESDDEY